MMRKPDARRPAAFQGIMADAIMLAMIDLNRTMRGRRAIRPLA